MVKGGSKRGTTRFPAIQNQLLLSGDMENSMDSEQHEDSCTTRAQSAFQGERIIEPRNRIRHYQAIDQVDVDGTLHQAGWMAETKLQEESIGTEKDPEYEEYEQNPQGFLEKYHEAILERARHRPDVSAISPHALKDTPRSMKMPQSDGSVFSLRPHQLTGVGEMEHLESLEPHGGILADDMGLGKTVQIMALICRTRYKASVDGERIHNLIVTPKSLLPMWQEQLAKTKHPILKVLVYHGPAKADHKGEDLKDFDVVLTTYDAIQREYKDYQAINDVFRDAAINRTKEGSLPEMPLSKRQSVPLVTMEWGRLILEESHHARNATTATFKAVYFLKARKRWAITGTPFFNEYTDVYSLLKFLRLKPWCVDELFQRYFIKPKKDRMCSELLMVLPNKVLVAAFQSLAIRRERGSMFDGRPITDTQDPIIHRVELILDDGSKFGRPCHYFGTHLTESETQTRYPVGGDIGDTFRKMTFTLMAAVHYASPKGRYNDRSAAQERDVYNTAMGSTDVADDLTQMPNADIPPKSNREEFKAYVRQLEHTWHSTKIDECVAIIVSRLEPASGKVLVFSDWMTCLDILSIALEEKRIRWASLDGEMSLSERSRTIKAFQDEANPTAPAVLLITSRCSSHRLTLTAASTVIMLNASWTPLSDAQCIARANRIGQKRTVHVYYLHVLQSMEDHKLDISNEKQVKSDRLMDNTRVIKQGVKDETYRELVSTQYLYTLFPCSSDY